MCCFRVIKDVARIYGIFCNRDGFGFKTLKIEIVITLKAAAKYQQMPLEATSYLKTIS